MIAQRRLLNRLDGFEHERFDQHAPCLVGADAAGAQIEQRILVEIADSGAVRAFDIVGEDFELGLGVDGGAVAQEQRAAGLLGVGFLRALADADGAEESAVRPLVEHAFEQLAGGGAGRCMVDDDGVGGVLVAALKIGARNADIRAVPEQNLHVLARQVRAKGQAEILVMRGRCKSGTGDSKMNCVGTLILNFDMGQRCALADRNARHRVSPVGALAAVCLDDGRAAVRRQGDELRRLIDPSAALHRTISTGCRASRPLPMPEQTVAKQRRVQR